MLELGQLVDGLLVMVVLEGEHVSLHRHPASMLDNLVSIAPKGLMSFSRADSGSHLDFPQFSSNLSVPSVLSCFS